MNWFYAVQGQQAGPVDQARFEDMVRTGAIKEDTLVWHDGLDGWKPYGQVRGVTNINLPAAAPAVRYGGFWIRFVADIVDGILMSIIVGIVCIPLWLMLGLGAMIPARMDGPGGPPPEVFGPAIFGFMMLFWGVSILITAVYNVYFLTTRQATPGKLMLGLKVIRADGQPGISTGLAIGRFFAEILTGMTFYIGYIIAGFDDQKRALHDHICSTRVVYAK